MQQQEAGPEEREAQAEEQEHGHGHGGSLAEQRRRAAARNWLSAAVLAAAVILGTIAGTVWAFGGNTPPNDLTGAQGVNFRDVIASTTIGSGSGGNLRGSGGGFHAQLAIPTVAVPASEKVTLSEGKPSSVSLARFQSVPAKYRSYHAIGVFGASFRHGGQEMLQHWWVTLSLTNSQIRRGDVVMFYARNDHTFQAAGVRTQVLNGQAVIRLRSSTDIAVLAP